MATIMVSCGEASGDLYAGALVREVRALDPGAQVFGFGGDRLGEAGAELIGDYRGLSVTGLVEVVRLLPRTYAMYRQLVNAARERRPDALVAVDFPDFNFRLARAVAGLGIPVVYYVSPQLWAWRSGRLEAMKRFAARVLVIFPFEPPLYERAGIPVEFVGHPLIDLVTTGGDRGAFLASAGCDPSAPTIALLPGSRTNEVRRILPVLLEAAPLVAAKVPEAQFVIARAPGLDDRLFDPASLDTRVRLAIVEGRTDAVISASDLVVTASGTATVQTALHERPMVIVYRLSPLTYRAGIRFVKVDTYGMVNLVAGRRVVPELIQDAFTPDTVAREAVSLLTDRNRRETMRNDLHDVKTRLGGPGASRRAAERVLEIAAGSARGPLV
jgi:lipid-A-disaccharide synthase